MGKQRGKQGEQRKGEQKKRCGLVVLPVEQNDKVEEEVKEPQW